MTEPMKTLELHYPVIQFLLIADVPGMIKLLATDKNDITWLASIFIFISLSKKYPLLGLLWWNIYWSPC